ncbi:MAG: response regulator [Moraxellaceae bacterium]|nr:MAG: response regulator [Moraxellaceae bacterium]
MKILLVDHSPAVRRIEVHILSLMGLSDVKQAEDGASALKRLQSEAYGLVIADWDLPNMSGLELLEKIRTQDALKKIPVLMVVTEVNDKIIMLSARAGVSSLIVKPFTINSLREKIDNLFPYIPK